MLHLKARVDKKSEGFDFFEKLAAACNKASRLRGSFDQQIKFEGGANRRYVHLLIKFSLICIFSAEEKFVLWLAIENIKILDTQDLHRYFAFRGILNNFLLDKLESLNQTNERSFDDNRSHFLVIVNDRQKGIGLRGTIFLILSQEVEQRV